MISARDQMLRTIRLATGGATTMRASDYDRITREYRRAGELDSKGVMELFIDRLHDYGCGVYRCGEANIRETIGRVLAEKGKRSLLIPPGLPSAWLPAEAGFIRDENLSYTTLEQSEGVLTGCAAAIALTGTIVLEHSGQRRALTLLPDYHLCVVLQDQIVETVPEAFARLSDRDAALITTISGPSATADIEMTRIKGVHGPRSLDVIVASPIGMVD